MKLLQDMTLEELAREWHATIKGGGVVCDVAIELTRRQRLLDVAETFYQQCVNATHWQNLLQQCAEFDAAYAAAKETP